MTFLDFFYLIILPQLSTLDVTKIMLFVFKELLNFFQIGILMTDGKSNAGQNLYRVANRVKDDGINMFVIAVTNSVRESEINSIASEPASDYKFYIDRFTSLTSFVDQISTTSCDGK